MTQAKTDLSTKESKPKYKVDPKTFVLNNIPKVPDSIVVLKQITESCFRVNYFQQVDGDCVVKSNRIVKSIFVSVRESFDGLTLVYH